VNRRTSATAASALLLLLAGSGGHQSGGAEPADAGPAASCGAPVPRRTTPKATQTEAFGHDEVEAQLRKALADAHAPEAHTLTTRACAVSYLWLDVGRHYPDFRKDVVASLHASGWRTGPGGGPDETVLTDADGWQAFVDQRDVGKINGTGSPTRELLVGADCT
jgi:hypothetical protein